MAGVAEDLSRVVATQGTVVGVTTNRPDLYAFDTETGRRRWTKTGATGTLVVFTDKTIVELDPGTSILSGIDWTTGSELWSAHVAGGANYLTGMSGPADDARLGYGLKPPLTSNQVVVISRTGQALLYDTQAGKLLVQTPIGGLPNPNLRAYGGWLYTADVSDLKTKQQVIRATDLTGGATSGVVVGRPQGTYRSISPCGAARVCVVTETGSQSHLSVYDVPSGKLVMNQEVGAQTVVRAAYGKFVMTNLGDDVLDVYNESGPPARLQAGRFQWIDDSTLLQVVDQDGATPHWARYSLTDGRVTVLGAGPSDYGYCASTGDHMICPTGKGLVVYVIG